VLDGDWGTDADGVSDVANNILYCGYHFDAETTLYHVRNRMYNAELGRFITRDPLGYVDGMSTYGYLSQHPNHATDPSGFEEQKPGGSANSTDHYKQIVQHKTITAEQAQKHRLINVATGETARSVPYVEAGISEIWQKIASGELAEWPGTLEIPSSISTVLDVAWEWTVQNDREYSGSLSLHEQSIYAWGPLEGHSTNTGMGYYLAPVGQRFGGYHTHPVSAYRGSDKKEHRYRSPFSLSDVAQFAREEHVSILLDCECTYALVALKNKAEFEPYVPGFYDELKLKSGEVASFEYADTDRGMSAKSEKDTAEMLAIAGMNSTRIPRYIVTEQRRRAESALRALARDGGTYGFCVYSQCGSNRSSLDLVKKR
jgi:RHS repeat-associated protein